MRAITATLVFALASAASLEASAQPAPAAAAPAAPAQKTPSPEEVDRARTFFNAGAQAYSSARYADAVRAFEQAYELAPRPPVLFSLAQAERKEFFASNDGRSARRAVQHYKEYLDQVASGGRRAEATEAKADLEARIARLDPAQTSGSNAPVEKRKARLTVYSATPGAQVSVDGGAAQELPYFGDVEAGRHRVRVFADGFVDAEQEVSGDKPIDIPLNLPLKEKPALLTVVLDTTADVYIDGRIVATAPVSRPIEVPSGVHVIGIGKNGKKPFSNEVTLERGKPFKIEPKLETTGQRVVSVTMLGAGGLGLVIGALSGLTALGAEKEVRDLEQLRNERNLTSEELDRHNARIDDRDAARTAFIASTSIGAALAIGGGLLYVFDKPSFAVLPPRSVEPTPQPKGPEHPIEVTGYPVLGPSTIGAGFSARF